MRTSLLSEQTMVRTAHSTLELIFPDSSSAIYGA
jgi:hypothetical protein